MAPNPVEEFGCRTPGQVPSASCFQADEGSPRGGQAQVERRKGSDRNH